MTHWNKQLGMWKDCADVLEFEEFTQMQNNWAIEELDEDQATVQILLKANLEDLVRSVGS